MTTLISTRRSIALAAAPVLVLFVVGLCGCGSSPPSRYYTLDSTCTPGIAADAATAGSSPAATLSIVVRQISIPASVDRPQFVVQIAPNEVAFDEFERWAGPLEDDVARTVAGNLAALLGTPLVTTSNVASFSPACAVTIDIQRFESIPGEAAIVEAFWTAHDVARNESTAGRTIAREPVQGKGFDLLAAAHSRAIGKLSSDIAAAIRASSGR